MLFFCFFSADASAEMNENFDSYNLGDISSQGLWASYSNNAVVSSANSVSSPNSLLISGTNSNTMYVETGSTSKFISYKIKLITIHGTNGYENGYFAVYGYSPDYGSATYFVEFYLCGNGSSQPALRVKDADGATGCGNAQLTVVENIPLNVWHDIVIEINYSNANYRIKYNDQDFSGWAVRNAVSDLSYLTVPFSVDSGTNEGTFHIDNVVVDSIEDSGTIEIISPTNDETVLGSFFDVEFNYWNHGETSAPFDKVFVYISDSNTNTLYFNYFNIDTDNVEEEKNRYIPTIPEAYLSILGTYDDVVLSVVLYNSVTGESSDSVQRTFNIETPGSRNYVFNYPLDFLYDMDYVDGRPSKTFNNINDQEIIVSAGIGDISCDDITSGYFDYNSYTDNTFSTIDVSATINRFVKGGLYLDCQSDEVFLYLKVEPENPGPGYYQLDYYDDTGQTNKLNFLRFVIYYDVDNGVTGGVESQNPNEALYCDDMTLYFPNYLGEPFKIDFFNKVCKAIFAPPSYFPNQMDRIKFAFESKFAFLYQIKNKIVVSASAISAGSTSPPVSQSGSYNGMSFNISDMFGGLSTSIVWFRSFFSVFFWLGFIIWLLADVRKMFINKEEVITS